MPEKLIGAVQYESIGLVPPGTFVVAPAAIVNQAGLLPPLSTVTENTLSKEPSSCTVSLFELNAVSNGTPFVAFGKTPKSSIKKPTRYNDEDIVIV